MPFDKKISMPYKLSGKTKFSMASCIHIIVVIIAFEPDQWSVERSNSMGQRKKSERREFLVFITTWSCAAF